MSEAVLLLRLEHDKIAKLLDVIEAQLERLNQADDFDCGLVAAAVDYLRSYGDECHHPKEDLIYRALLQRNPEAVSEIGNLAQAHELMARTTEALAQELKAAQNSRARASRLKVKAPLAEFLKSYRRHLAMEEEAFFPAALSELTESDWGAINFDIFDREDPLFSNAVEQRYERLRRHILARSQ